ncbi:hypothetical protein PVAND_002418 [Polypedilum vanderplanki]|uniref:Kinase suppressor of Ras 2 n=1 Tax=Polypedilum vanderplanki TaxID=319348 RepID=A0A9J6BRE5_POLVA|nr:hypothetical protein PVAND_002418 [Polypedilum vanderplanki]
MADEGLEVIQSIREVIDISADHLDRLRTQCATSVLTLQETRKLESKLVRMFCELLLSRQNMSSSDVSLDMSCSSSSTTNTSTPNNDDLHQWLRVVGLSQQTINAVIQNVNSLETLLKMNDDDICAILVTSNQNDEARRLVCAINNLKRYQQCLKAGTEPSDMFWDSWDRRNNIRLGTSPKISNNRSCRPLGDTVIINSEQQQDDLIQSPVELSPPETQISTSSLMTTGTLTSSSDKLLNMISPEECSVNLSPSPPQSPPVHNNHNNSTSQSSLSLGSNKRLAQNNQKIHHNNINNNILNFNNLKQDNNGIVCSSSILTTSITSNNINNNNNLNNNINNNYHDNTEFPTSNTTNSLDACEDSNIDGMSKSKSNESQLSVNGGVGGNNKQWQQQNGSAMSSSEMSSNEMVPVPAPRTKYPITTTSTDFNNHQQQNNENSNSFNEMSTSGSISSHSVVTPIIVSDTSAPPRSPCTPVRGMGHMIQHRFSKKFKFTSSTCDLCNKQMFFGFKCTECKYRCHKDCKSNVPPSCGLPKEFVDEFKKTLYSDGLMPNASPNLPRALMPIKRETRHRPPMHSIPFHDSSSAGSSCNSSSPSSPALLTIPPQTPANKSQFNFPEVSPSTVSSLSNQNSHHNSSNFSSYPNTIIEDAELEQQQSGQHSKTIGNNSASDNNTGMYLRNNYQHSFASQNNNIDNQLNGSIIDSSGTHQSIESDKTMSTESDRMTPRLESVEERDSIWPRQNSLSLKEWDIPYDDLNLGTMIGKGRFGTVYRGNWHGDVAVKILKEDFLDDEHAIEAFKLEVAIFKNTRHENLVLFMGACMKPPRLAIVTSMCKGNTLYTHVHLRRDKFNLNKTTLIAQQISQGMGYLHRRGIVHKDLKSKNIFLENEKVIITDFGLFSVTKLVYDSNLGLGIPYGWLCYMAPELIRNLKPYRPTNEDLQFTKASDTYAFGTIWYELLCGEFPFKSQPPESVIWQVGRGMKQSLSNLQASRDVKDILMMCWTFNADDRPDFNKLFTTLERLPKKRLARSPSHPIQLSRSAESVF